MKINKLQWFSLLALFACFWQTANASNFAVNGVAARAQSMQAFVAVADDPSAIYYNPAGLTQVKKNDLQANVAVLAPNISFKNNANGVTTRSRKTSIAPSLFFSSDHYKSVVVGVGLYSPFARVADYKKNAAVNFLTESSDTVRLDLAPTLAFQVNSAISLGVSLVLSRVSAKSNMLGIDESAVGYGATGQAGILVKLPEHLRFGVSYRGHENVKLDGDGKSRGLKSDFTAHLPFPATLSTGIAWQATPKFLATIEYDEDFWSYLNQVHRNYDNPAVNPNPTTVINARDEGTTRVGFIFTPNKANEIRAGYSYAPAAEPKGSIAPAQPDYNANYVSVGYSHYFQHLRINLGYEYAFSRIRRGTSPVPTYQGEYVGRLNTFMLGIGYQFA